MPSCARTRAARSTTSGTFANGLKVHFADLTDRTSVDYLVRELRQAPDRPYVFHLGAQAHVGESWHRPYETVSANVLGTLNLLQAIVDWELELEKFDTAGTSEEYGNVREGVSDHHDFDEAGGLILHERSPINPKSIYATSKVAADFLTMNYFDAFAVPGRRHAHVQQLRAAPEPALRHRHDRDAGARARHDRAREPRAVARLLLLHGRRARPPHRRCAGRAGRRLRLWAGREHLDARLGRAHPATRRGERLLARRPPIVTDETRFRPGASDVLALRVGHEKLTRETGWQPKVSWEDGVLQTIRWYAENRDRWIGRVDWMPTGSPLARFGGSRSGSGAHRPPQASIPPSRDVLAREVALLEPKKHERARRRNAAVREDDDAIVWQPRFGGMPPRYRLCATVVVVDVDRVT